MLIQDTIVENILACLLEMVPLQEHISADSDMVNDLGLESVKMMDLLMKLEDEYDISIPINILMDVRTPRQLASSLVAYVEKSHGAI
ncbi:MULTISPECIES: phosphopantetheine-binding protein [Pseudomonas]|uniref:acyl carrier protein n=1 Tax=Pseudomonas TaxID=286 RepID=UPI000785BF21|nr:MULTISPECIES: phosphopantetheine-binding protein [Pseudomonas]PNG81997.1 Acyl carrier protein [Pseudomonas putida]QUN70681.1 acyl carrier protein [Pseudomonas sp. JS425]URD45545.1 phosphopantetheine-binding protein [Pseudomonas sp. BYT-5]URK95656.1 acyl carrier protein [Pseudomonas sp. BYT-1]